MARVFKTRGFVRVMRKSGLKDSDLCDAVEQMQQGLIDADLGGRILKKRVALPGKGKRGSVRTVVATNRGDRWFFVYGFKKNEKADITDRELEGFQKFAADLLGCTAIQLDTLVGLGELEEICNGNEA
jgi:hypothetical protein